MQNQFAKILILSMLAMAQAARTAAQSLPIAIDSRFEDWTSEAVEFVDAAGDGTNLDLLRFEVANDENYLFLRLELAEEVVLTDNNDLTLFFDTDQNALTGKSVSGIGAELELNLGDREGRFYHGNSTEYIDLEDVQFHHLPTFSSEVFEMAIGREAVPDGVNPLFTGSQIRILWQDGTSGDKMPDAGQVFSFQFDTDATPPFQPIDLQKLSPNHIRLLTWNTLFDGLLDDSRAEHFRRVLNVLQPDIVTFNECWDMTAGQAATFLNVAVPLGNFQSWTAVKLDAGNITVSRFPILQNWEFYPGHRLTASLLDLPDGVFEKNLLVVNGHLRCCDANYERQQEADAFAKFILDATSPGGGIALPEGTPFVLSGDMNLVGWRQQYTTLVTGDIVNTATFGSGGPLDWDGTDLLDVIALQADQRMAYTWHEAGSQYPPSRLDYFICSNSVMEVEKSFALHTEIMSQDRLTEYGLELNDNSSASDHLPKVTDFSIKNLTAATQPYRAAFEVDISPNPAVETATVGWQNPVGGTVYFRLKSMDGSLLRSWEGYFQAGEVAENVDVSGLSSGVYWLEILSSGAIGQAMLLKM
ncbi:MAG: hypothetical protein HY842_15185 [Bacteroidetes bacterium]|nr:hypothetical protein [Bacteroidota bacterium]